jgi:hypothetical protein
MTKFGIDQIESPPPKWWRKLERAFIIGVAPAITAMILAVIPDDDKAQPIGLAVVTLITSIVKSIGIFLGNGEQYADADEVNI